MIKTWGNIICAIDTETTGLDCEKNEIIEVCILPLDSCLDPYKGIMPFHMYLKPELIDNVEPAALRVAKVSLAEAINRGTDQDIAADLFDTWFQKLPIGENKRIIPLGQNYQFDMGFISKWIGPTTYNDCFHYHYRDSMIAANLLNDRADFRREVRPFDKVNLQKMVAALELPKRQAHTALDDAINTSLVYKRLVEMFTYP